MSSPEFVSTRPPSTLSNSLVARGRYEYWVNAAPAGVTETWAIYATETGRLTRSDRIAPAFGSHLTVEAHETEGALTHCEVHWQSTAPKAIQDAHANYTISNSVIRVERTVNGGNLLIEELTAPAQLVVSPLMRIFQGSVIKQVAALGKGQRVPVLVPWIMDPTDSSRLLTAHIDYRSATRLGIDSVDINGQPRAVERYQYLGGNYDDSAEFFIDEKSVLARYTFQESAAKVWDVRLCEESPTT